MLSYLVMIYLIIVLLGMRIKFEMRRDSAAKQIEELKHSITIVFRDGMNCSYYNEIIYCDDGNMFEKNMVNI